MHFSVHWCIAMHFSKNAILVLDRVKFCGKKLHTFIQPVRKNKFLMDYNPMTHRSQKCSLPGAKQTMHRQGHGGLLEQGHYVLREQVDTFFFFFWDLHLDS